MKLNTDEHCLLHAHSSPYKDKEDDSQCGHCQMLQGLCRCIPTSLASKEQAAQITRTLCPQTNIFWVILQVSTSFFFQCESAVGGFREYITQLWKKYIDWNTGKPGHWPCNMLYTLIQQYELTPQVCFPIESQCLARFSLVKITHF